MVLFVAPEDAERTFRRVSAALPEATPRRFHSLLIGRPGADLVNWHMADEVDALQAVQTESGEVDLVAYSGGAAMCLLYAAAAPPIRSLTLIEPPWIGNDEWASEERNFVARFDQLTAGADRELVEGFFDLFAPGHAPILPEKEIARMAPPLRAVWRGYRRTPLNRSNLTYLQRVLLPLGGRSSERMRTQARELAKSISSCQTLEVPEADHFDIMIVGADRIGADISEWLEPK